MRLLLLLLLLAGCVEDQRVTVGAAASLQETLTEIARAYRAQTGIEVQLVFASSGKIAQQHRAGAGFDAVVMAADGFFDGTPVAGNRLVLLGVESLDQLPGVERIAIGAPDTVPAGTYARQALQNAGVWDQLDGKLVFGTNVRQVLAYADRGEVDAAIVYATDAPGVAIDASLHDPIVYPATSFTDDGQRFVAFLQSPIARDIFAAHGFTEAP